ncbi:MAG: permease-like cell division protein FtsX [candidate division Zixibacteria bacterium]|nr:permease-like cell division protein FtsX [candidate division Zixibacteria bacterium]
MLFDLFWVAVETSEGFYENLLSDMRMEIYVREDMPDSLIDIIEFNLNQIDGVSAIKYVSKEDARNELISMVGIDLLAGYETTNPLPRSFVLTIVPDKLTSKDLNDIEAHIVSIDGVEQVYYSQHWLGKVESARKIIFQIGMILGGLIFLTALISSANNLRFMTRFRAVGFYQMRLLGAGKLFMGFPFIIEGMFLGITSSVVGWGILYYGSQKIEFNQFELIFPSLDNIILFCVGAGLLGIISGYLGLRKL